MFVFALVFLVSAQTLHTTLAAVAKHHLPIQYPEPIQQAKHEKDDVPDQSKNLTYCTIKPKKYSNEMLKRHKPSLPRSLLVIKLTFDNRQADPGYSDNCESEVTVSAQTLHTTLAAVAKHPVENLPIRYPEPIHQPKHENDDVPDQCKNLTYCTIKPKNYPEEKFNEMLNGHKPSLPQPSMVIEWKIENRQRDIDSSENCESEVTYEPLYKVRESNDQPWQTVIQAPDRDFVQRIRIERCINPGAKCFTVFTELPEYVTFCEQRINTWEVLVAKGNNETETIKAELPVCCSCRYRPVDFLRRFGKPKV